MLLPFLGRQRSTSANKNNENNVALTIGEPERYSWYLILLQVLFSSKIVVTLLWSPNWRCVFFYWSKREPAAWVPVSGIARLATIYHINRSYFLILSALTKASPIVGLIEFFSGLIDRIQIWEWGKYSTTLILLVLSHRLLMLGAWVGIFRRILRVQ